MGAFKRAFATFCLGVFGFIPTASVSQWVLVEPGQDYYVDVASIQRQHETVTYWGKYQTLPEYVQNLLSQASSFRDESGYLVEKNQINCSDKTIRFVRDTIYNSSGEAVLSQDYPSRWHPILPRTVAEEEWKFVCSPPPVSLFYAQTVSGL